MSPSFVFRNSLRWNNDVAGQFFRVYSDLSKIIICFFLSFLAMSIRKTDETINLGIINWELYMNNIEGETRLMRNFSSVIIQVIFKP